VRERLYRSRRERMLFGVAGGMARYLNLDPAIVRLVWVLLFLAAGSGILLYIVAAIVIPEEPEGGAAGAAPASREPGVPRAPGAPLDARDATSGAVLLGAALIVIGAWFLLQRLIPALDPVVVWPVVLIVLGGALILGAVRRGR
jgi:phage shock protein C